MVSLVPSIIAKDFADFEGKIVAVQDLVQTVHLDVVDGKFAPNISWGDPSVLREFDAGVALEAHLMIANPEETINDWLRARVQRVFYHYESTTAHEEIIAACKKANIEVGIALLPETSLEVLEHFVSQIDAVLLLSVSPGFYGSPLQGHVMEKISPLRKMHQNLTIEIDGGMNPDTARQAVQEGANFIVSGSYIFQSENVKKAIEEMKRAMDQN